MKQALVLLLLSPLMAMAQSSGLPAPGLTGSPSVTVSGVTSTSLAGGGTQCLQTNNSGVVSGTGAACGGGGGSSAFSAITGGTNTSAAMIVGSGATMTPSGSGEIQSNLLGADLDCTKFSSSGDMSQAIAACLTALHSISSIGGIADATGFTGNQTWSINPFAGQTPGTTIPWTGELRVCTTGTITLNVPIVQANYWRIVGCGTAQGAGSKSAAFTASGTSFQPTYSTGTITVGTAGQGEVITGSGTTWTSNMVGCAFVSPSTQPTSANSTYGIIHSVGSTTSITLGYGANNGSGAPSSSNYAIYCPMVLMGTDGAGAGSPPAAYTGIDEHLSLNCNNVAGCVDVMNWYGEEGVELSDATLTGYTNIGYDIESNYAQNSSPGRFIMLQPGSSCTSGTISFENRTHAVATKPFKDSSINNPFCSTSPNVGLDIQGSNIRLENLHIEGYVSGISVSNNTSCPVACAQPPTQSVGFSAEHINAAASGTNVISLGSTGGSLDGALLTDITVSAGATWTNVLADTGNSCTDTATRIGAYLVRVNGGIQESTSTTSSCQANPTFNNLTAGNTVTFSAISGSTQCLQASSTGVVSGTGSACGSGGGGSGTVSGQASGVIPLGTSATVIGSQSHMDDGNTTAGTITSSEPLAISGSTNGAITLTSTGTLPSAETTNQILLTVPNTVTHYTVELPAAQPTSGNTLLSCTAANPSVCSWGASSGSGTVTSIATTSPITGGTITTTGTIACATCTTNASALTSNAVVLGGGGQATKTAAGFTTDGTSALTLGVAGTSVGSVGFNNATSGTVTLSPVTGALGTVTASLPANTGTLAELNLAQTWTANQTFPTGGLITGASQSAAALGLTLASNTGLWSSSSQINMTSNSSTNSFFTFISGGARNLSTAYWGWTSSSTSTNNTTDTMACRGGAAGVVSIENGSTCTNTVAGGNGTLSAAIDASAINQQAASNTGGTCTMTTTSCTITIAHTYTTPVCIATVQSSTVIAGGCTVSGTTVTITAASSNTSTWGALVFGNPN